MTRTTPLKPPMPPTNIIRQEPEAPLRDVMGGAARWRIDVLDHGFLALVDAMPRLVPEGQTADSAIVQAARVSYGAGTKKVNEDRGLIRYLLRHRHTTPFEMVEFKFHVAMPIFIARQWIRHRTANVNEYSGRYSIMPDTFYRPTLDAVRKQSAANRQGGEETFVVEGTEGQGNRGTEGGTGERRHEGTEGPAPQPSSLKPQASSLKSEAPDEAVTAQSFLEFLDRAEAGYPEYLSLTQRGVSRELARIGLPLSLYTQWYWKCDLHNILRFLALRLDPHAQLEIRAYAQAMHDLIEPIVPVTMEAWRDYEFQSIRLSRLEVEALRRIAAGQKAARIESQNKREQAEWEQKLRRLGMM